MRKLTWEGPRNPATDYTEALIDSNGDTVLLGETGSFNDGDAELLSVHHILESAKGTPVEPPEELTAPAEGSLFDK